MEISQNFVAFSEYINFIGSNDFWMQNFMLSLKKYILLNFLCRIIFDNRQNWTKTFITSGRSKVTIFSRNCIRLQTSYIYDIKVWEIIWDKNLLVVLISIRQLFIIKKCFTLKLWYFFVPFKSLKFQNCQHLPYREKKNIEGCIVLQILNDDFLHSALKDISCSVK